MGRPIQLQLNFIELKKQEKEEERTERKRFILLLVIMGTCFIVLAGCVYLLEFYWSNDLLTKSMFLRILFRFGLILSGIGLMLGCLALGAEALGASAMENEKTSPKLKVG